MATRCFISAKMGRGIGLVSLESAGGDAPLHFKLNLFFDSLKLVHCFVLSIVFSYGFDCVFLEYHCGFDYFLEVYRKQLFNSPIKVFMALSIVWVYLWFRLCWTQPQILIPSWAPKDGWGATMLKNQ